MKIGNKIHKVRELKNITAKDMAERLDMTLSGYQRIERDDVSINMERLLEIAGIFEMKPEDLLTFDEKTVFNNHASNNGQQNGNHIGDNHYHFPEEMKKLYEDKIKLLEEKNQLLWDKIDYLEEKIKGLEGK